MTLDRWFIVGLALFIPGAVILTASLFVHSYRATQRHKEFNEAMEQSDAAMERGDFAEARRILYAIKKQSE